jgi:hypothetical protein
VLRKGDLYRALRRQLGRIKPAISRGRSTPTLGAYKAPLGTDSIFPQIFTGGNPPTGWFTLNDSASRL